jgi:elongation factor Ts
MEFTAKDVAALRERTGTGMMDCKAALTEANGDFEKAIELLREKGKAAATKKAGRIASQGVVDSYIHLNGKIGVLLEVNCETDFVAKNADFLAFVHEVALQIAAFNPTYISIEEVPADVIAHEESIYKAQALNDPKPKPMPIIEKMVAGRIVKFYKEVCLLEQDCVKDPSKTVKTLLTDLTGKLGEKISIRRFVRYEMGAGLEKRDDDFVGQIEKLKSSI